MVNKIRGCCGRRSFRTLSSGQVGITPGSARKADMVDVLHGYTNSLMLRPITSQCRKYQIVGNCFVDSIMSGGLVLGRLPEHVEGIGPREEKSGIFLEAFGDNDTGIVSGMIPDMIFCLVKAESNNPNGWTSMETIRVAGKKSERNA